jgi:histidinol-phosphate aminotransferase
VLIRDVGIAHRLRVTIGTPEENDAFLQVARDVLVEETEKA